jgi:hypothetical protein
MLQRSIPLAFLLDLMLRRLPFLPRLSLGIARRLSDPDRAALIDRLLAQDQTLRHRPVAAYVATPRRFLRPDRLARKRTALTNLLTMIDIAQQVADRRGLGCRIVAYEQLRDLPPARLVLSHHTVEDAMFRDLRAQGAAVWHFKTGDLPGSLTVDQGGFSGWSSLATRSIDSLNLGSINLAEAQDFFASRFRDVVGGNQSKYLQPDDASADLPSGPYVFVALQTIGDMVQRQAHVPMLEMLTMIVRRFAGSGVAVVVKRHPKCRSKRVARQLAVAAQQPHVRITIASIHQILSGATAVFTVNSGVGSEAMLHKVPIYCFGGADYAPVAHSLRSDADLVALTSPIRPAVSDADLVRFHAFYRQTHQIQGRDKLTKRVETLFDDAFAPPDHAA